MKTINYNKFIAEAVKKAREHDTPISGSFELTPLCNLDCRMCYIHLTDPTVKERMLSGEQWIDLMRQAIDHGMMIALLTGGEAMTHPDFRKIYLYLIEQGISVHVKTNGILLNREMVELFTEYPPYIIDVSLYGCDGESYMTVTGYDVFETVTANVRAAIAAGLHVRLMITPSAYMLPWVDRIMEYAKNLRRGGCECERHADGSQPQHRPQHGRLRADPGRERPHPPQTAGDVPPHTEKPDRRRSRVHG